MTKTSEINGIECESGEDALAVGDDEVDPAGHGSPASMNYVPWLCQDLSSACSPTR